MRVIAAILLLLTLLSCRPAPPEAVEYKIAVIPKGTTHVFWKSIHAGAVKSERALTDAGTPVDVIWKGPLLEDDRAAQINVVENFIAQQVDAIVLAPLDRKALVPAVKAARIAGIPVVVIDSGLDYDGIVSFAATDNFRGGEIGGEYLAELLGGMGKVILLRLMVGSASTEAREAGFLEAIADFPDIEVLSANQYGGPTRDTAFTAAQNLLNRFGEQVDGIFTPNESTTNAMLLAVRAIGRAKSIKFVGFDGGDQNIEGLKVGDINGIVVQDPFRMGYLGVKLAVDYLQGISVNPRFDTGVQLVTIDNLDRPEIQTVLFPPLGDYLD